MVFTYPTWATPEASAYRPEVPEGLFPQVDRFKESKEVTDVRRDGNVPQVGESWWIKNRNATLAAMEPRNEVVRLLARCDERSFWALLRSVTTRVSLRELIEKVVDHPVPQSGRPERVTEVPGGPGASDKSSDAENYPMFPVRPVRVAKTRAQETLRRGR